MKRKLFTLIKMHASSAITFVLIFFNYTISYAQNLTKSNPADDFWIEIETSGENYQSPVARTIDTVYAGTEHGVVMSTDTCKTWQSIGPIHCYISLLCLTDNGDLIAGCDPWYNGSIIQKWDGISWTNMYLNDYNTAKSIIQASDGSLIVGNSNGIFRFDNGIWRKTYNLSNYLLAEVESLLELDNGVILAAISNGDLYHIGILRSTDHGISWEHVGLSDTDHIVLSKNSENDVYAATDNGIFISLDSGLTWNILIDNIISYSSLIDGNDVIYVSCHKNGEEIYRTTASDNYVLDNINQGINLIGEERLSMSEDGYLFAYYKDGYFNKLYRSRESVYSEFSVELVAEPADAGFVNGSGYYLFGDRAQLNASPSNGFQFVCWINQDGDTISCDPDYRHFVTRNNLITALFDEVSDMPEFSSNSTLIWPNPVSDVLSIDGLHDNDIITIYDVTGCMVYRQSYHGNTGINMSTLNSGIYFMSVESVSGKSVLKLVKQ